MANNYFIGAGLSAYFSQLLHWQEGDVCLYPSGHITSFKVRRSNLDINKLFASKSKSMGSIHYQLLHARLHDRCTLGGNSEIWGGFFDTSQVSSVDKLIADGLNLVPLSYEATGSISEVQSLVQLQEKNGYIINSSNHLRSGIKGYLDSIECQSGKVKLKCIFNNKLIESDILTNGRVFICTGVAQTIDLLIRSLIIKPGDELTLDEFSYEIAFFGEGLAKKKNACVISYAPIRAFAHLLGIQKAVLPTFDQLFNIHQIFYAKTQTLNMVVGKDVIFEKSITTNFKKAKTFGKSIHYCNLRINGQRLVDLAARLSPNLHFVGMATVKQKKPGPISSDIFSYLEKIK